MTDRRCDCGRPLRNQAEFCPDCERATRRRLGDQAGLLGELRTELARQVRKQAPNDGGRAASLALDWMNMGDRYLDTISVREARRLLAALPPVWPAAALIREQDAFLRFWSKVPTGDAVPESWAVPVLAGYLIRQLPTLRRHEQGPQFVASLRALVERITAMIDLPENRTRIHVGPCPETHFDDQGHLEHCPGQVEAIVPADESKPAVMRCLGCKTEWPGAQWNRAGHRINQRAEQLRKQRQLAEAFAKGRA